MLNLATLPGASFHPPVLCDASPPRGGSPDAWADAVATAGADAYLAASNPGRNPRADAVTAAGALARATGVPTGAVVNTRDMNRIALQAHMLGAGLAGVGSVVALAGDGLGERERAAGVTRVRDVRVEGLLEDVGALNAGRDYLGRALDAPLGLCAGAAVDTNRDPADEAVRAVAKVAAGAAFLITQPLSGADARERFLEAHAAHTGGALAVPVYWGVQVVRSGGVDYGGVPAALRARVEAGEDGERIAIETAIALLEAGAEALFLLPPVARGGGRDYAAVARVLAGVRG
jgi:5,10-methylenetetrahydrofolate reductase